MTQKPKNVENTNSIDIKNIQRTKEYPKLSRKLSRQIRQSKKIPKVGSATKTSNSSLHSKTIKS